MKDNRQRKSRPKVRRHVEPLRGLGGSLAVGLGWRRAQQPESHSTGLAGLEPSAEMKSGLLWTQGGHADLDPFLVMWCSEQGTGDTSWVILESLLDVRCAGHSTNECHVFLSHRCQRFRTPPHPQTNSLDTRRACTLITTLKRGPGTGAPPRRPPTSSEHTSSTRCTGERTGK